MDLFLNILTGINWEIVAAFVGSGAVVAWVAQLFKRWKGIKSSAVMQTLAGSFSMIAACAQYIHTLPVDPAIPVTHAFAVGGWVFICSQAVYQVSKLLSLVFGKAAKETETPDTTPIVKSNAPEATGEFI